MEHIYSEQLERYKELAIKVADYLADWLDDSSRNIPFYQSIRDIESYGVSFGLPNKTLVRAAIRHLKYCINPWNNLSLFDLLQDVGFSDSESRYYLKTLYED